MNATPGHGFGKIEHGFDGVEERAIPVLFEHPPDSFDGIVLAVIGRIVSQLDGKVGLVTESGDA